MADLGFIAQGVRPVQVDTPTEAYAKQLALQNAAQEQTLRDQQIQAGKQETSSASYCWMTSARWQRFCSAPM